LEFIASHIKDTNNLENGVGAGCALLRGGRREGKRRRSFRNGREAKGRKWRERM